MTRSRSHSYSDAVAAGLAVGLLALLWASPASAETVTASWYGAAHHGKPTASGRPFNMHAMTAAHPKLPFGTRLRVCRTRAEIAPVGRCVTVRVNDRGPYIAGRALDLSAAAARAIGLDRAGVGRVSIHIMR